MMSHLNCKVANLLLCILAVPNFFYQILVPFWILRIHLASHIETEKSEVLWTQKVTFGGIQQGNKRGW